MDELNSYSTNELISELYENLDSLLRDSYHSIYSETILTSIKEIVKMLEKRPEFVEKDQN
jgi:hypothetical protein